MAANIHDRAAALYAHLKGLYIAAQAAGNVDPRDPAIARIEADAVAAIERELRRRKGRTE